jgi:hypothetical protein
LDLFHSAGILQHGWQRDFTGCPTGVAPIQVTNGKQYHLGVLANWQYKLMNTSPLFIAGDSYGQKVKLCFDVCREPFENAR